MQSRHCKPCYTSRMNTHTHLIKAVTLFVGILVVLFGIGMVSKSFMSGSSTLTYETTDPYAMNGAGTPEEISNQSYAVDAMPTSSRSAAGADSAITSFPYYPIPYGQTSLDPNRQFITNYMFNVIVDDLRARAKDFEDRAKELGGFASSSTTSTLSDGTEQTYLALRVPADKADSLQQTIRSVALRVVDEEKQSTDTTDQLVDIEARLKSLRESETQYSDILKQATNVDEILRITQARSDLRMQIEQLEAQKQNLNSQVAFSTVNLTMSTETGLPSEPAWRPLQEAKLAWQALLSGLAGTANLLIAGIVMTPLLLVWLGILWLFGKLLWWTVTWLRKQLFPNA